jgi:selenocysteine lyase/cysteine desulfurase
MFPDVVNFAREENNIVVRTIGRAERGTQAVRVSTPIWLSTKDIDQFAQRVSEAASNTGA